MLKPWLHMFKNIHTSLRPTRFFPDSDALKEAAGLGCEVRVPSPHFACSCTDGLLSICPFARTLSLLMSVYPTVTSVPCLRDVKILFQYQSQPRWDPWLQVWSGHPASQAPGEGHTQTCKWRLPWPSPLHPMTFPCQPGQCT